MSRTTVPITKLLPINCAMKYYFNSHNFFYVLIVYFTFKKTRFLKWNETVVSISDVRGKWCKLYPSFEVINENKCVNHHVRYISDTVFTLPHHQYLMFLVHFTFLCPRKIFTEFLKFNRIFLSFGKWIRNTIWTQIIKIGKWGLSK